ncbi:anthranilate synthase component I family protein [Vulcanisaeta thermophila]|uniref:anthranilate synthase component I family protein n=1 Tax=Vulcanisaeta thermophila TaxID=867917 RepID=UPI000853EE75|nr:chorismate-binding protein [Vulcanisaeta thermophila]
MIKVPMDQVPRPRDLVQYLLSDHRYVALLESGPGFPDRARYTVVAWDAEEEVVVEWGDDLYGRLKDLVRDLGRFEDGELALGYLSYEAVINMEPYLKDLLPRPNWPLAQFFKPRNVVIYDNLLGRAYVRGEVPRVEPRRTDKFEVLGRVGGTSREAFISWVESALEDIRNGEVFQVVLSRYEDYKVVGDPMHLYTRLADLNPSPYMYIARFGGRYILGTSPELLVKVDGDRVETHPIAGTRPRGRDHIEDLKLEDELLSSIKDRAEHVMLVDLARNDLGKVCRFGTVRVKELYALEKYQSVQHLVSRVEGILERGYDIVDALFATFPAGTVSGAPKPRAMELIAKYEGEARGPYAGAIGVVHGGGGEFAITIRSMFISNGIARIQAGAGIVYDSKPELEFLETEHKLGSLKAVMGVWT